MKLRNKEFDEKFEVITFGYADSEAPNGNGDYPVEFISLEAMDEDGDNYEYRYRSLKDFNAVWEDYTPAEPLIKDEKIRKVVRAWAEIHKIEKVFYCEYSWKNNIAWIESADDETFVKGESPSIDMPIIEVKSREYYTIAELCGEEDK